MFRLFRGVGGKFWMGAYSREVFRFSLYIFVPIGASAIYANPDIMASILTYLEFVKVPGIDEQASLNVKPNTNYYKSHDPTKK